MLEISKQCHHQYSVEKNVGVSYTGFPMMLRCLRTMLIFTDKTFANFHRNTKFMKVFSHEINSLYGIHRNVTVLF